MSNTAPDIFSLAGKAVLVTGAGRGNGEAIADGLTRLGADVIGLDLRFGAVAKGFETVVCDVTDDAKVEAILAAVMAARDRIDGLVNNAGISLAAEACYTAQVFEQTVAVNTLAPLRLSWRVAEIMKARGGGSIVNITSLGAHQGFPDNPAYQASKAALRQITKAMAVDYGRFGVRVNNLCPGYIVTDMTRRSYNDAATRDARGRHMALPRWGNPEDLIGPCAFLISQASCYVTGIDLPVDGGWLAKGL